MKPFADAQILAFIKEITDDPLETLMTVTLFTGMREGEVMGLTWDCVDFEHGTLTINKQLQYYGKKGGGYKLVQTKNGKSCKFHYDYAETPSVRAGRGSAQSGHSMGKDGFRVYR